MNRDLVRPSPATHGGRATGIISEILKLWKVFFTVMESILYSYGKYS